MTPTYEDVAAFTGRRDLDPSTVLTHLSAVEHMVRAYTRGRGFDDDGQPGEDLAAVIVSACARQVSNPTHQVMTQIDDYATRHGIFNGWTLPELAILHRHRKRVL